MTRSEGDGMPFIYDETEIEWPEDGSEPPPPRADQFVYLSPPNYGGAPEPVRFSVAEPQQAAEPAPAPGGPPLSGEEFRRRHEKTQEERRQRTFAFAVPELRKTGVQRFYCRYDGGHDEGFSRLDRAEMTDGTRLDADALSRRLTDAGLLNKIYAAGIMRPSAHFSDRELLRQFLDHWLANEWATMLLGDGYGTGEYSMYGAFTVDLEACTVFDDRHADPVVQNIRIAT
jgi:hypothetical protein